MVITASAVFSRKKYLSLLFFLYLLFLLQSHEKILRTTGSNGLSHGVINDRITMYIMFSVHI